MNTKSLANQSQILASEPKNSTWVGANAGSGKTKVLIDRVTRLLLNSAAPQHILCLTYTKAAASHMQNKLFERLGTWSMLPNTSLRDELNNLGENKIDDEKLAQARRLFARALDTPGGLKIQTIHSFCSSILRRFPMEAGVSPHFRELDDRNIRSLQSEILDTLATGNDYGLFEEFSASVNLEDPHEILSEISKYQEFFSTRKSKQQIYSLFEVSPEFKLKEIVELGFSNYEPKIIINSLDLLEQGSPNDKKIFYKLKQLNLEKLNLELFLSLCDIFLSRNQSDATYHEKPFPTNETIKIVGSGLDEFTEFKKLFSYDLIKAKTNYLNFLAAQETFLLYNFSHLYLNYYQKIKIEKGYLDFDDQILLVKKLLSKSSVAQWVMYQLDDGIEHILIDEAQDTSPDQWDIIKLLSDEFNSGITSNNKKRTIFAVGDEKQSIYSFQGADPFAFEQMRSYFSDRLKGADDKLSEQKLLYSFRSSPIILKLVDKIFNKKNPLFNISNQHIAYKADLPGRIDLWPFIPKSKNNYSHSWFEPIDSVEQDNPNLKLAAKIASEVKAILDSKQTIGDSQKQKTVTPGDFLILLRSRKMLFHAIIKQLKLAGLPVAGADRLNITTELVVKDLLSLFNFLNTPDDDLNFANLLKSPLCGFSEKKLFDLAQNRNKSLWLTLLSQKTEHIDILSFLNDLRSNVDFLRPYEILERTLINHNKRAAFSARLGLEVEESINALLEQARKFEKSHIPDLTSFILWMETDDVYIKRELETESTTIRVMTIHGSKGLESPIVILPDTSSKILRTSSKFVKIDNKAITLRGIKNNQNQKVTEAIKKARELQIQEEFRLLYVSLTRAENWLIICGAGNRSSSKDCWYDIIENEISSLNSNLLKLTKNSGYTVKSENWSDSKHQNNEEKTPVSINAPEWVKQSALEKQTTQKRISPSKLIGLKSLTSEENFDSNRARELGSQIHTLLEHSPNPISENWEQTSKNILKNSGFYDLEIMNEALNQVKEILTDKKLHFIFSDNSNAEVSFQMHLPRLNNLLFSGIIDRIIFTETTVTAIDFKSNFVVPDNENEVPTGILKQMAIYLEALTIVYPNKEIEIAILWIKNLKLMYLNKLNLRTLLDQSLTLDLSNIDS